MPTTNARKHTIPAIDETSVTPETVFEVFGNSIRDIVPVANTTERALLVSALTSLEPTQAPSSARPLVVYRHDAPGLHRLEYTVDGSVWLPASGVLAFSSKADADTWATSNGSYLTAGDVCRISGEVYEWNGSAWIGGWNLVTPSSGWSAITGYRPRVHAAPGKRVFLEGAMLLGVGAAYSNLGVVPAGLRPQTDGAPDVYAGQAIMSFDTNGTAFMGALLVNASSGVISVALPFASDTATAVRVVLNASWKRP